MVGVGRLELPTSASQMPRAADCAIPQNMSTQFFTWRVPPSHMITRGVITMLRTTFCHNSIIPQGSRSTLSPYPVKKGVPNFQRVKTSLFLLTKQHFSAPNYVHYSRNSFGRDPNTGIVCICDIQAVSNGVLLV